MNASDHEGQREILPKVGGGQQLLFPLDPRQLCRDLGLNWWAVTKLYEDGMLSFNPDEVTQLDEGQESELRFLAALVVGDCGGRVMAEVLQHLPKPFRYRHSQIYYDWQAQRWRPLPTPDEPSVAFSDWLETLTEEDDRETLEALRDQIDGALQSIKDTETQ